MTMMGLTARGLEKAEIARAYALVQFVSPDASYESWCRFAQELLEPLDRGQSGILTVQDSRDVILGILHYKKCPRLSQRTTMLGLDPVTCGASTRHQIAVMLALLSGLEHLAMAVGCSSLACQLPRHLDSGTRRLLQERLKTIGYGCQETSFMKSLGSDAATPPAPDSAISQAPNNQTKRH